MKMQMIFQLMYMMYSEQRLVDDDDARLYYAARNRGRLRGYKWICGFVISICKK